MNGIRDELIQANADYAASFGDKARLALPPARAFLILTCMDARLDPAKFAGLAEGDAHVVRNAGGRASQDAMRSLAISHKLLGTKEWFVIHHTDCGMEYFKDDELAELLAGSPVIDRTKAESVIAPAKRRACRGPRSPKSFRWWHHHGRRLSSRNSRSAASSGRRPVLAMNST
jgi:carbonic anhydrase